MYEAKEKLFKLLQAHVCFGSFWPDFCICVYVCLFCNGLFASWHVARPGTMMDGHVVCRLCTVKFSGACTVCTVNLAQDTFF